MRVAIRHAPGFCCHQRPARDEVYAGQMAAYARALSAATGLPVRERVLVFARPAVEVSLP